jgi:hypothetical protein
MVDRSGYCKLPIFLPVRRKLATWRRKCLISIHVIHSRAAPRNLVIWPNRDVHEADVGHNDEYGNSGCIW